MNERIDVEYKTYSSSLKKINDIYLFFTGSFLFIIMLNKRLQIIITILRAKASLCPETHPFWMDLDSDSVSGLFLEGKLASQQQPPFEVGK